MSGLYGTSSLWHRVVAAGRAGFVTDVWLYTGSNGPVVGESACSSVSSAPVVTSVGSVLGDNYPPSLKAAALDALVDPWGYYNRECTSFVAWRLNSRNGVAWRNWQAGRNFGNANTWDDAARAVGYRVDGTPAVGSVAQTDAGPYGHVAWVAQVNGDGSVTVEEYNYAYASYSSRRVPAGAFRYIHVRDL